MQGSREEGPSGLVRQPPSQGRLLSQQLALQTSQLNNIVQRVVAHIKASGPILTSPTQSITKKASAKSLKRKATQVIHVSDSGAL